MGLFQRRGQSSRERRRSDRKPVAWIGSVTFDGLGSVPCRFVDVSRSGALLELDAGSAAAVGSRAVVMIDQIGETPVGLQLQAIVRREAGPAPSGSTDRVGIELRFDTPSAHRVEEMLFNSWGR